MTNISSTKDDLTDENNKDIEELADAGDEEDEFISTQR
jgi:hypothetical protein